jgi:hypothetical protein
MRKESRNKWNAQLTFCHSVIGSTMLRCQPQAIAKQTRNRTGKCAGKGSYLPSTGTNHKWVWRFSPPGKLGASLRDCFQEQKLSRDQVIRSDDVMKSVGPSRRARGNCWTPRQTRFAEPRRRYANITLIERMLTKSLEVPFKNRV